MSVRDLAFQIIVACALSSVARADDIVMVARKTCASVETDPVKLRASVDDRARAVKARESELDSAKATVKKADDAASPRDKKPPTAAAVEAQKAAQAAQKAAEKALGDAQHDLELVKAPQRLCGPDKIALWASLAGKNYPTGYLEYKSPGFCNDLKLLDPKDQLSIENVCYGVEPTALGLESVAINLVQGLGDLLVADAKAEVIDYFLANVAKDFCGFGAGDFSVKAWFGGTCKYLLDDRDSDSFNFDELKTAFEADLKALPKAIADYLLPKIKQHWPSADKYAAVAGAIFLVSKDIVEKKKVGAILDDLDNHAEDGVGSLQCDFTTAAMPEKACTALLALRVARTAADDLANDPSTKLSVILQDAFNKFCADHGKDAAQKQGGACVVSSDNYRKLHDSLLAVYQAAGTLIGIQKTLRSQTVALPGELAKRTGPEAAEGIRELVHAMKDTLVAVFDLHASPANEADKKKVEQDVALVDLFLDAFEAAVQNDPAALRKAVLAILSSPQITGGVSADTIKAITVVVSLATAKDRAEAKSILSDAAAPVGTYKMKYGSKKWDVTINGYVGFSVSEDFRNAAQPGVTSSHASKLAMHAPVGIDLTAPWCSKWFNFGFGATLLDPLALDVSTTNDTVSADWKTLFVPGAYIKFGLLKTPLVLGAAVDYSFAERAVPMSCGSARCYDGAWQVGVFLSADVPLFVVH